VRFVLRGRAVKAGQTLERYRGEFREHVAYGTTPEAAAEAAYLLARAQARRA
jgi:hypothetical protein